MASDLPHSSNTYILDPESAAEMARLIDLDRMTTKGMGGPLHGLPSLPQGAQVLDIACGPGGWALDVAFARPDTDVTGIDISQTMITYANARARSQRILNTSFGVMNVTKPLDFSDNTLDLVNGRLLSTFLLRDAWPGLLQECLRILRPGGVLRITEADRGGASNSPAFEELGALLYDVMHQAGYGFSPNGQSLGITPMLPHLLHRVGFAQIQYQAHAINVSARSEAWTDFYHHTQIGLQGAGPMLLKKSGITQERYDQLYQDMLAELQQDDFCGMWYLLSVCGIKPAS